MVKFVILAHLILHQFNHIFRFREQMKRLFLYNGVHLDLNGDIWQSFVFFFDPCFLTGWSEIEFNLDLADHVQVWKLLATSAPCKLNKIADSEIFVAFSAGHSEADVAERCLDLLLFDEYFLI